MNLFFELADAAVEKYGHKHLALYGVRKSSVIGGPHRQVLMMSNRVWAEEEEGVRFLKHRYSEASETPVDMKEFFWIKLKSYTL